MTLLQKEQYYRQFQFPLMDGDHMTLILPVPLGEQNYEMILAAFVHFREALIGAPEEKITEPTPTATAAEAKERE